MTIPRRVAITGLGVICPMGDDLDGIMRRVYAGESGISRIAEQTRPFGLSTELASLVTHFDERSIPRQLRRSMSRVSQLAVQATSKAIGDADLPEALIQCERTGIAYGSTMGGTSAIERCYRSYLQNGNFTQGMLSTTFLQIMSHTCGANLVTAFQIPGRLIASCVACSASTQAIGFGYEAVKFGLADRMLCGGAEEFHLAVAGVFDVMRATSTAFNDRPSMTPRPFAKDRDGIVVGEGAGTLILEEWEAAKRRGAKIYAEIVGFSTNSDGSHMTNPSVAGMANVMNGALASAGLSADQIDYVNAHGTATSVGDLAESRAVEQVLGTRVPISSLKGHFGHLMGACGIVESAICLGMMQRDLLVPTLNLEEVDPECAPLAYVRGEPRPARASLVLKNSFAFGGINATLIFKKA